ncbi:YmfQ family protein [Paenibacillus sp. p3-SID1389]|uniref:YmfQ family protein n=1 Tax=Paenibacillus sp. p3-SID1389 TaxID=2916364 RepID=UPI0021A5D2E4|nr:YmfQ family protein [Paenibacillus sp. p3-SID1389]MCT2195748.1 YmfQ family protein [Paenibacillus sp. p3-SID1389]
MSEFLLTSPRGREMFSYLPGYYETSRVMQADMNTKGAEMDLLFAALDETFQQFFVRTATWGLDRWESELGITTDLSKPLDQRRAVVESKLRGSGKFSGRLVKNVAEAYDRGRVEVSFQPGEWGVTVRFVDSIGAPPNLDDLKGIIEEIKPAHMAVVYRLNYLTIAQVEGMTITQIESTTQDKLLGGGL